jgi:hypothetical protein
MRAFEDHLTIPPFNTREGERERKEGLAIPVLAQRAVADAPRWTRARWEPARPPLQYREEAANNGYHVPTVMLTQVEGIPYINEDRKEKAGLVNSPFQMLISNLRKHF